MIDPTFLKTVAIERGVSNLELETLSLAMKGESIEAIAHQLEIREDTVRKRLSDIYRKFEVPGNGPVKRANLQQILVTLYQEHQAQISNRSVNAIPIDSDDAQPHKSWDEAPDTSVFYGRQEELAQLKAWIIDDKCRVVALLGMGGIGKTALSVKIGKQIHPEFEYVIWRSLRHRPDVKTFVTNLIKFLSHQKETQLPEDLNDRISLLIDYLRLHRCLLIIDNFETILKSGDFVGHYAEGQKGYGLLLKRLGEEEHKSCLIITSREKPREIALLEGDTLPVRSLQLEGLKEAAKEILKSKGLSGEEKWGILIKFYQGHPLALKIISATIQELFEGNVAEFVNQSLSVVIKDVGVLLEEHFSRLAKLEKEIIYWLAIEGQPISLIQLQKKILLPITLSDLVNGLESLAKRSLIEKQTNGFTLQFAVREYVVSQFVQQICQEIETANSIEELKLLKTHLLTNLAEPENIEEGENSSILNLVKDKLYSRGNLSQSVITEQLNKILSLVQGKSTLEAGYTQKNVQNILAELKRN